MGITLVAARSPSLFGKERGNNKYVRLSSLIIRKRQAKSMFHFGNAPVIVPAFLTEMTLVQFHLYTVTRQIHGGDAQNSRCTDILELPGCYLRIAGTEFLPDSFLASSSLNPTRVWYVGDPLAASGPRASRFREWAGFTCNVSDVYGDLDGQIVDAIVFLTQHRESLLLLNEDSTIEDRRLDFGFNSRLNDCAMQGEWLPVNFLRLVAEFQIGVALSLYPACSDAS